MREETVSVNGTIYDSRTGKPLHVERGHDVPARHNATSLHASLQKSRTLNRRYVHREIAVPTRVAHESKSHDTAVAAPSAQISVHKKPAAAPAQTATTSKHIAHFAPHPKPVQAKRPRMMDIGPAKHPLVQKAAAHKPAQPALRVLKPSQVIKQEAIATATENMKPRHSRKEVRVPQRSKFRRFAGVGAASVALLILGAYITYLNMPALSTRVAATQAGINASYPSYQPSGYSLSGPVAYQQGSVTMKFVANAGPEQYTLSQTSSDWDSSAVLDNYVIPKVGKDYTTSTTSGLTIYNYGTNATWVNGGILYTLQGNAPLSNEQIQHIATSL